MPTYTPNYNLVKPLDTEFYNIDDQNSNMDIIDSTLNFLKNNKGTWLGDSSNAIPDLNEAEDGVYPITEYALNLPNLGIPIYGNVLTMTGRNYNFRVQLLFLDDKQGNGGVYIRKKILNWEAWESAANSIATTAEAQAGTNNTNVMTPLRTNEAITNKALLKSTDATISKSIPSFRLQTPNGTKSYEIRLNANDTNDYGLDIYRNGTIVQRLFADFTTQFRDTDGTYFSVQSLKQSVSNGKAQVAAAITGKGVSTAADASFATLTNNINAIQTNSFTSGSLIKNVTNGIVVTGLPFRPRAILVATSGNEYTGTYFNGIETRSDNSRSLDFTIYNDGFKAEGSLLSFTSQIRYECFG